MKTSRISIFAILLSTVFPMAAMAANKEMIQLQTQVQALEDAMARMQQSFDERMGVMKNLVEQSTDNVNKMTVSIDNLQKSISQKQTGTDSKFDQVSTQLSTQIQSLHDSVDELKARMMKVTKQLDDMQAAQQNLQSATASPAPTPTPQPQAPPPDFLYNSALRDYNAAKYDLAAQEFSDYMKFYSNTDLAGNAQYYLADIEYHSGDYQKAAQDFDKVLEQYPGGNKAAAAQLKKAFALIQLGQKDAGSKELRSLIARYPHSPEAQQARDRLRQLGGPAAASREKPSAGRPE